MSWVPEGCVPICNCGRAAVQEVSVSEDHKGETYWRCPFNRCNFFYFDWDPRIWNAPIVEKPKLTKTMLSGPEWW